MNVRGKNAPFTGLLLIILAFAGCERAAQVDAGPAVQHDAMAHEQRDGQKGKAADEHAAHKAAMAEKRYTVSSHAYEVPDVQVLDTSGSAKALREILLADEPVALNFIFTTCTTICPVMTATFAQVQRVLGDASSDVQFVSITIDPEYDRPDVLKVYADQFGAGANWTFLTGDSKDIVTVMKSFGTYAGSKMNHPPVYFLRNAGDQVWIRVDGLASATNLAQEVSTRLLD